MKRSNIPRSLEHAWAAHEALRRVGFPPDSIFLNLSNYPRLLVTLRSQGKEFNIEVGDCSIESTEGCAIVWDKFIEDFNAKRVDSNYFEEVYHEWLAQNGGGVSLCTALLRKGFALPSQLQAMN